MKEIDKQKQAVNDNENLPAGWKKVKLGEVVDYEQPTNYIVKSESYDQQTGIPVLTAGKTFILGYTDEKEGIFKDVPVIIFDDFTTESKFINFPFKVKSSALKILKLRNIENNIYFLFNAMHILNFNPGSEHKRYWISEYSNILLALPPLPEQEKIAEILETVDNTIEKTDAIIEKYKRTKQGLMQELLTKGIDENWEVRSEKTHKFKDSPLGRISADWEVKKLGEVSKIVSGFSFPLSFQGKESGLYPFIKVDDLNSSYKYIKEARNYINNKEKKELSVKTFHKGTLVFPKIGMAVYLNKFRLLDKEATFDNNVAGIVPIDIDKEFIYYYFLSEIDLRKIASETALPSIKKSTLENLQIPLPPLPEQERIASVLSQVDTVIEKETAYRDKLSRIKQGLMEDLLTGKVRVTTLLENNQYQKETFI